MTYCIHAILDDVVFGFYDPSTNFGSHLAGPVIFTVRRQASMRQCANTLCTFLSFSSG